MVFDGVTIRIIPVWKWLLGKFTDKDGKPQGVPENG